LLGFRRCAATCRDNVRAGPGEGHGDRLAKADIAAGDERHFTIEAE